MATKKDLVEAYSFSRRRLVTAFVSGAPGGREVEPARLGRTIIGGLALAVLLVAGAAIAGIFSPSVAEDWADRPGLIVSKETGALYVITGDAVSDAEEAEDDSGPVLRPVINPTSALLILGAETEPEIVPQSAIDDETIGDDIGILNAPASPPSPDQLIQAGWTACTDNGQGIRLAVTATPGAAGPAEGVSGAPGGFVVESEGDYYVIAQARPEGAETPRAHRYLLPGDRAARDDMLSDLDLDSSVNARRVPEDWLGLFPAGGALEAESFQLEGVGSPVDYAGGDSGVPTGAEVGDFIDGEEGAFLLTAQGPTPLDAFSLAVYRNLPDSPTQVDSDDIQLARARETYLDARWPSTTLDRVPGAHCAQLLPEAGVAPAVQIASDATEEAAAVGVPPEETSVAVDDGRGAYVVSGDWEDTTQGSPFLVDGKGYAYPLVGLGAADLLGYADVEAPAVPDSWVELFREGVDLSQDAALCPPDIGVGGTCD